MKKICGDEPSQNFVVHVRSNIRNPSENIEYRYEVTGGYLVDSGKEVDWNLKNMQPGTYWISMTPYVDNKPIARSLQAKVRVKSSICICDCSCPEIAASGPKETKNGEIVKFDASVSGGSGEVIYNWILENGEIISGQGTPTIRVRAKRSIPNSILKATVEFSGFGPSCSSCLSKVSVSSKIVD